MQLSSLERRVAGLLVALVAGVGAATEARAQGQSFGDFGAIGRLEDARQQPSDLTVGGHTFEPSIVYKILGITTPHVMGSAGIYYSDNYLRADHDAGGVRLRREPYAVLSAGTRLDTELSDHRLELSYLGSATELLDTGRYDLQAHTGRARLDLYATDVEAHFDGVFRRTFQPQSIQLTGVVELDTVEASGWVEGRLGEFGLRAGGSMVDFEYLDGQLDDLDRVRWGADAQLYWRVRPKLRLVVEYNFIHVEYDEGRNGLLNDYDVHQVLGGIDGMITPKLNASIKVGHAYQNVLPNGPGSNDREFRGWTALASVSWQPFERTTFIATYSRQVSESTTSNFIRSDDVSLQVQQLLWNEKITVTAGVAHNRAHVSPGDNLNRISTNCSVEYRIRQWLSLRASYDFERLSSPFRGQDYRVHTVGISIGVGL